MQATISDQSETLELMKLQMAEMAKELAASKDEKKDAPTKELKARKVAS